VRLKRLYIKVCRYIFKKRFLKIFSGVLRGYYFTTGRSYEYLLGNYEAPAVMDTFIQWCVPDAVFYDIGSNAGYYSLVANRFITTGKIYAVEPLPENIALLQQHIALNKKYITHNNIIVCPFAIAGENKAVLFSNSSTQSDGNTYIASSPVYAAAEKIMVQCYTIDELVRQGYAAPSILKIDVEGAEYDVLEGAAATLKTFRPYILLATHDFHLPGVKDKCVSFLTALGYIVTHTGGHNKNEKGLDDFIAIHKDKTPLL